MQGPLPGQILSYSAAVPSLSVSPDVCRAGPLSRFASASCLALALPVSVSCQDKCYGGPFCLRQHPWCLPSQAFCSFLIQEDEGRK